MQHRLRGVGEALLRLLPVDRSNRSPDACLRGGWSSRTLAASLCIAAGFVDSAWTASRGCGLASQQALGQQVLRTISSKPASWTGIPLSAAWGAGLICGGGRLDLAGFLVRVAGARRMTCCKHSRV